MFTTPVFDYFKDTERIERLARQAVDYLEKQRERQRQRQEQLEEPKRFIFDTAETEGYRSASAVELLQKRPALSLRMVQVGELYFGGPLKDGIVTATDLSSAPALLGRPSEVTFLPAVSAQESVHVRLNLHRIDASHEVRVNLSGIPVGKDAGIELSDVAGVDMSRGTADVEAAGSFDLRRVDIPFLVRITGADITVLEGESVLGLDPQVAGPLLSSLDRLEVHGSLRGRTLAPRVSIDTSRTVLSMREGLRGLGSETLRRLLDGGNDEIKDRPGLPPRDREPRDDESGDPDGGRELEDIFRSLF